MGLVAQHQLTTFASPVNGTTPIDANTVRGNDNTIKTSYNAHDADVTIHVQNGALSSRPSGSEGMMWLATDADAVLLSLYTDSAWVDLNYVQTDSTGAVVVTSTTAPQFTVKYDDSNKLAVSVSSAGAVTYDATGASAGHTFSDPVVLNGGATATTMRVTTASVATVPLTAGVPSTLVSSGATVSIAVASGSPTILGITNAQNGNSAVFTQAVYAVVGRAAQGYTITSLASKTGGAGCTFTVAQDGTNAAILVTNTSAGATNVTSTVSLV